MAMEEHMASQSFLEDFFFLSLSPRRQLLSFSRDEMCTGVILDAEIRTYFPLAASAKL